MPLPNWLFKNPENNSVQTSSTMAGGFSMRNLLKGENAFAAQIPSVISTGREKKRVIVNDFSLPFVNGKVMILMLKVIDYLMEEGFEVYTIKVSKNPILTRLSADPAKCDLRSELDSLLPITVENVSQYDKEYSADGTVLLDYGKSRELVLALTGIIVDFSTASLLGSRQFKDLLHTLVIPCYKKFGSLQGHALPEIILDEYVLNLLHYNGLQDEIQNCLHWGFRYIIYSVKTLARCLADPDFPKNKITGINIRTESELKEFLNLNHHFTDVTKVWFFGSINRYINEVSHFFPNAKDFNLNANYTDLFDSKGVGEEISAIQEGSPPEQIAAPKVSPPELQDSDITRPNKLWQLHIENPDNLKDIKPLIDQDKRNQKMRHCRVVLVDGDSEALALYLKIFKGCPTKFVSLTFDESTKLPEGMLENTIESLELTLHSLPTDFQLEQILRYFPELVDLSINISADMILSYPETYYYLLVHASCYYCANGEELFDQSIPILQKINRMMEDFLILLDPQIHEKLIKEIYSFLAEPISYEHGNENHEAEQDNIIYDADAPTGPLLQMSQKSENATFNMIRVCEVLAGGKKYNTIRRRKFYYDFSNGPESSSIKHYVKPVFSEQLPEINSLVPTHKMQSIARFEWNEDYRCYCHQLPGLTKFDRLCDWRLTQGSGDFELRYSLSDNFYYMTSKEDPGTGIGFSYRLHDPDLLDQVTHQDKAARYRKEFKKEDRAHPQYNLEDVRANPEYYNCAQRSAGFLFEHRMHHPAFYGVESWTHDWIEHETGTLDLGGRPSSLVYENQPARIVRMNDNHIPFQEPKSLYTVHELASKVNQESTNTLLLFDTQIELERVREVIIKEKRDTIIVIDKPSDLNTSHPYFTVSGAEPGMGALPGGWIVNQLKIQTHDTLLIDWSNFCGRELPQNNSCIGKINHRRIENYPLDRKFHVLGLALKNSPAAQDRSHVSRHRGNVFYVARTAIPYLVPSTNEFDIILTVDLHSSPQWFEILLGEIEIEAGQFQAYSGCLFDSDYSKLIIKNPPKDCQEFDRFITHVRNGTYYQYFDGSFRFNVPIEVEIQEGYNFEPYAGLIENIYEFIVDQDLQNHKIDQLVTPSTFDRLLHDTFIDETAVLNKSAGWLDMGFRSFYLTRTLPEHQLCALLDKLLEFPEPRQKLHLYCAPEVIIPTDLLQHVAMIHQHSSQFSPLAQDQDEDEVPDPISLDYIINISGRSPDDLLYGNKVTHAWNRFTFEEEVSDVFKALLKGKNICLTGCFSDLMLDHLSTLLLPSPYLWHQNKKVYVTGKLFLCPETPLPQLSWITSSDRIISMNKSPDNPISIHMNPDDAKKNAIDSLLKHQPREPAVLIQGPPGIGKSCFIRSLIDDHKNDYKIFSENQLTEWALDKKYEGKHSVLVIDESTIRGTDWSVFEGLYSNPPHLLIKNKIYFIEPHQRVLFLGNQTEKMPTLFKKVAKINFPSMTRKDIITKILRPILLDQAEQFYDARANAPVRQLHAEAIAQMARKNPRHTRFTNSFGQFILTPSRLPVVQSIISCLNARHFRLEATHDSAKYGGQCGIWIEGPAGIGKTDLIRATLNALDYFEGIDYIVLPANMDPKAMMVKITEAFDKGLIVVIDELDTALSPEMIAEINSFLMGENLNFKRPTKAGFTLMATGNGPSFSGRTALPESLRSRLACHKVAQYPEDECRQMLTQQCQHILAVKPDFAWTIEGHLRYHITYPNQFTFREACAWLMEGGNPALPKLAPKSAAPVAQSTGITQLHQYKSASVAAQVHQEPFKNVADLVL